MNKIIFFLSLFFVACSMQKINYKPKELPKWYLTPPKSTKNFVYITGSGVDKKEAVLNALSNFSARYFIKVSSSFEIKKESFGGYLFSSVSKENIKAKTASFIISDYEIIKAEPYKDKILVLIKIDVKKLSKKLKSRLDERFENYKILFNRAKESHPLKKLILLKKLYTDVKKEIPIIYILSEMSVFDKKRYLNFISEVYNEYQKSKNSTAIFLRADDNEIKEVIKKYLTSKGIKIAKSGMVLEIKTFKKYSNTVIPIDVYNIYINLKYKGNTVASNHFKVVVAHKSDMDGILYEEIRNKSLEEFFNMLLF